METKTIVSKQGTLQGRDYVRGLIVGAVSAAIYAVIEALQGVESFADLDWGSIGIAAMSSLVAYLGKNLLEPTKVVTIHSEGTNPPPVGDPTHPGNKT